TLLHMTQDESAGGSLLRHIQNIGGNPTLREFGMSTLTVLAALTLAWGIHYFFPLADLSLIFLMPVLYTGVRYGLWPSLYTVFIGLALYNFFFVTPLYSMDVIQAREIATLLFFIFVALITGNMAVRLKNQIRSLRLSARRNAQMHDFSRKLAAALAMEDILQETVTSIGVDLTLRTVILMPEPKNDQKLYIAAHHPGSGCNLNRTDWAAAEWAWKNGKSAGAGSDTLPAARWYFIPLKGPKGLVALLGVTALTIDADATEEEEFSMGAAQKRMLKSFCDQAALAIDRAKMAEDIEETRLLSEADKLRSSLLSSISHDLRTPLVSMMGSIRNLKELDESLPPPARQEVLNFVLHEGERLNRFIQNLLDMTQLGYGQLQPHKEWIDLRVLVDRALQRLEKEIATHRLEIPPEQGIAQLHVDPVMMEQVLVNIIDNASEYAPAGTRIRILSKIENKKAMLVIADEGPGIPDKDRVMIFDMFYRVRKAGADVAGTGLGLAICKGLVEAHGGEVHAAPGIDGKGVAVVITFPVSMARDRKEAV
ncbi:MAG: DUF4118 domain-containing protein, partial [Alphaproteobacteria bacterium]|nr:DUF4118 domain-containing protein [Alphaproteobacteria bacterium]